MRAFRVEFVQRRRSLGGGLLDLTVAEEFSPASLDETEETRDRFLCRWLKKTPTVTPGASCNRDAVPSAQVAAAYWSNRLTRTFAPEFDNGRCSAMRPVAPWPAQVAQTLRRHPRGLHRGTGDPAGALQHDGLAAPGVHRRIVEHDQAHELLAQRSVPAGPQASLADELGGLVQLQGGNPARLPRASRRVPAPAPGAASLLDAQGVQRVIAGVAQPPDRRPRSASGRRGASFRPAHTASKPGPPT